MRSGEEMGEGQRIKDEVKYWRLDPNRVFLTTWHWGKETPGRLFFLTFLTFSVQARSRE